MAPKAAPSYGYTKPVAPYRQPGDLQFNKIQVGDIVRVETYPSYRVFGGRGPKVQGKYKLLITHLDKENLKGFDMLTQQHIDIEYFGSEMELFLESSMKPKKGEK